MDGITSYNGHSSIGFCYFVGVEYTLARTESCYLRTLHRIEATGFRIPDQYRAPNIGPDDFEGLGNY